ncbi:MAG: ABC transporter permease [Oscillospiraceae bacterium]|jgi:putative ABC transport system permease protein|nr:ABC transporter permease [Oscillospiraceae bacterium]
MMILINAYKSIARSKGRNILLGTIVLTIALSSGIALAIRSAADTAKELGLATQTITGSISVDRQKLMESAQSGSGSSGANDMRSAMQQYSGLSLSELQDYAVSDYVKDLYWTASSSLSAGGELEAYSTEDVSESGSGQNGAPGFAGGGRGGGFGMTMGDFSVTGYSSESAMTRFMSGQSQITDGAMFDAAASDYNCLISNELAVFNGLSVGSKIILTNPNHEEETYTFTVVGIYTNASSDTESGQLRFGTANDPANLICVSFLTLNTLAEQSAAAAITETDENGRETTSAISLQTAGTYVFGSKNDYDSFGEELRSKGLSEYYSLSSSDVNSYESSIVPLENLSGFATTLLIIILAVGAVILIVLNIFNIRERKYEVGVLTAIGIKKAKVAAQFVMELLVVTLIATVIGTGIGAIASVPISNNLLETQVKAQESAQTTQEQNFGRPGGGGFGGMAPENAEGSGQAVEYVDSINASVNINILLQLIGVGILLTILSSMAGVVFVLRYDPLRILANRA